MFINRGNMILELSILAPLSNELGYKLPQVTQTKGHGNYQPVAQGYNPEGMRFIPQKVQSYAQAVVTLPTDYSVNP